MANGGNRTLLIPSFHAENCLVKARNNRHRWGLMSVLPAERCPPDCWKKTRIVRVGGPRVGAV